ncbi:MAG: AbrB/MazE/SpoVT family DNA-binding domain-containing protein [Deltaproteobacteria bacterium]|nr:AbrB/MazE/SpoVT family DNA-binding domain-containing protein [Deltaproteobacteria bacterium]
MQTTLRKVGNSRGVLIPAAFLAACGIGTEIEMRQEGHQADKDVDAWAGITDTPAESEEWQW